MLGLAAACEPDVVWERESRERSPATISDVGQAGKRDSGWDNTVVTGLDRWAAWLGTTVAGASLGLVALADFGWFRGWLGLVVVGLAALLAVRWWHPPVPPRLSRPTPSALLAIVILGIGTALIAPGSENIAGPRDQAVYVATGFAIADGGSTTVADPALRELAEQLDPEYVNAWLYENRVNRVRIRFPAQLFIRDFAQGSVEGGFLPVVPVWIALATSSGGLEAALHVSGGFGIMALAFVMLACSSAAARCDPRTAPVWPLVGAILALSFSQIWWAREPMAEAALGAFAWLMAWATVRWIGGGEPCWGVLAALAASAALFTRADAVLIVAALGLIVLVFASSGRTFVAGILAVSAVAAALHDAIIAPIYMGTTYGAFTLTRAAAGLATILLVAFATAAAVSMARSRRAAGLRARIAGSVVGARRGLTLVLVMAAAFAALTGIAPGVERDATYGAASPLAWLPGYMPWPLLLLAAVGFATVGWYGPPRALAPLLLVGGLPALFYLADPLVTGDHPWMVRRLVPTVIPLLAVAASIGAATLWLAAPRARTAAARIAGPSAAAVLVGLGLALAVAMDRDLFGPRHGSGTIAGVAALAKDLPPNALVVFPAGPAGIHVAMPLDMVFGVDAFAIPQPSLGPAVAATLARLEASGRATYWASEGNAPLALPPGVSATPVRTARIHYRVADHGPVPPPLYLAPVDDDLTLYRLSYATSG